MIYPIVVYGDPVLKKQGKNLEKEKTDVIQLSNDMFETMEGANGIGLAAPQIGKSLRMFVVDGTPINDEEEDMSDFRKVFINPEIIEESGEDWVFEEGCLSIPDVRAEVERPERLRIRFFDEKWEEHEEEFDGMKARIIQHEYDHIEGILFTDHISPFKRKILKGKLTNISKGKIKTSYRIKIPISGKR
ncbi:MAG: peptide deformylase [Cyclobacteriaceae bacterium]|nr:peptide deformylase [Cyclobacteriaceae bacterium]